MSILFLMNSVLSNILTPTIDIFMYQHTRIFSFSKMLVITRTNVITSTFDCFMWESYPAGYFKPLFYYLSLKSPYFLQRHTGHSG